MRAAADSKEERYRGRAANTKNTHEEQRRTTTRQAIKRRETRKQKGEHEKIHKDIAEQ